MNGALNRVYVPDYYVHLVAYDGSTIAQTDLATVDYGPTSLSVNASTGRVYVANSLSDTVTVLADSQ